MRYIFAKKWCICLNAPLLGWSLCSYEATSSYQACLRITAFIPYLLSSAVIFSGAIVLSSFLIQDVKKKLLIYNSSIPLSSGFRKYKIKTKK